jgi:hypothetical protein
MTETQFQAQVESMLRERGLFWHHCRDARHCSGPVGLPDLIVAGRRGLILPELKSPLGQMSHDQWRWAHALGGYHRLWRPGDLAGIAEQLDALT